MNGSDAARHRAEELKQLIADAQKQPGLREVMAVYEDWRVAEQTAQEVREAMEMPTAVITSNSVQQRAS